MMVGDRLPGVPLVDIWETATKAEQTSYRDQPREQIAQMQKCTQPFIRPVNRSGERHLYASTIFTTASNFLPSGDDKQPSRMGGNRRWGEGIIMIIFSPLFEREFQLLSGLTLVSQEVDDISLSHHILEIWNNLDIPRSQGSERYIMRNRWGRTTFYK